MYFNLILSLLLFLSFSTRKTLDNTVHFHKHVISCWGDFLEDLK